MGGFAKDIAKALAGWEEAEHAKYDAHGNHSAMMTDATSDMSREQLADYYDERRRQLQTANTMLVEEKRELKQCLLQGLKDLMEEVESI